MTKNELALIEYLARDGLSPEQIRQRLGIKKSEWRSYFKDNPDQMQRLSRLKLSVDYAVEDALLKRALGYTSEERKEVEKPNGCEYVTTYKEISPDVSAAAMWLKCRRAEVWKEKTDADDDSRIDEILSRLDEEAARDA